MIGRVGMPSISLEMVAPEWKSVNSVRHQNVVVEQPSKGGDEGN